MLLSKANSSCTFFFQISVLAFLENRNPDLGIACPTVLFEHEERSHYSAVTHATHMTVVSLRKDTGPAQSRWHVEGGRTTADQSAAFHTFLQSCHTCPCIAKANSHRFSPEGSLQPPTSQASKTENNPGAVYSQAFC